MKIEQLLLQEHRQKIGGMTLTVKTCKKSWQTGYSGDGGDMTWWHQVLFMDETGEMPADVKIGKFIPLKRQDKVKVIVAEVREAEYLGKPRKILVVDQYKVETQMVDDYYAQADAAYATNMEEVRGKIRHGLVCADKSAGKTPDKEDILMWTEFIMTGRIE